MQTVIDGAHVERPKTRDGRREWIDE